MTLKTRPVLCATVALTVLSTTATLWAQTMMPAPETTTQSSAVKDMLTAFDHADTNKDGLLSPTEAKAIPGLAANFAAVDVNKDGMVSKDELAKAIQS